MTNTGFAVPVSADISIDEQKDMLAVQATATMVAAWIENQSNSGERVTADMVADAVRIIRRSMK